MTAPSEVRTSKSKILSQRPAAPLSRLELAVGAVLAAVGVAACVMALIGGMR